MVHSALTTRFATTTDYSSRNGVRVDSIGHHHAASTSLEGTLLQFQPGGREVSPNYCIEGRNIVLVVPEEYRAWTSSSAAADGRSITYEIINSSGDPDWRFSAETIDSVIKLDIDICRRYGITPKWGLPGLWQHKNLYQWFGWSYPTACAGPSFPQDYILSAVSIGLAGGLAPIEGDPDMPILLLAAVDDPKGRPHRFIGAGYDMIVAEAHLDVVKAIASKVVTTNSAQYDIACANLLQGASFQVNPAFVRWDQAALDKAIAASVEKALADATVSSEISEDDKVDLTNRFITAFVGRVELSPREVD